jgi:hypothetical protein
MHRQIVQDPGAIVNTGQGKRKKSPAGDPKKNGAHRHAVGATLASESR